jgi:TonB family protein
VLNKDMSIAIPVPLLVAAVSTADPGGRRDEFFDSSGIGLLPVTTLVIWVCCLIVGVIGIIWPGNRSAPPTTQPQSSAIEAIEVEVTKEPAPPAEMAPPPGPPLSPRQTAITPEASPPLAAMISADPLTPLAQPAQMPMRHVNPAPAAPPVHAANAVAPVTSITFGVGVGRQPEPEYPMEAQYAGQQGTVTVLFNVGQDGQVVSATVVAPCPWPILNQAAARSIRDTWHFPTGPPRAYMVKITYQMRQQ